MSEPAQITITLPDGAQKQVAAGTTVADFVKTQIGPGLAKVALFAKFNGAEIDLSKVLDQDGALAIFTPKNPESLELLRHDAAHITASVVQKLFPGTQVTIGPSTDDGFYYDFARDKPFTPEDLEAIEKAANEEVKADLPFRRREVSKDEALELFGKLGEKFKLEIIEDIFNKGAKTLSLYEHGGWVDFCLGPHGPGAATIAMRSCSASMAPPSSRRKISTPGCISRRRRASATTASSARSSICSRSTRRRPVRYSGLTRARRSSPRCRPPCAACV
jgi:threonyl-tRNA synthetase